MSQVSTVPARLAAHCRRAWAQTSECSGLCSLYLAQRQNGVHLGDLIKAISQYLVPYELAVCVRDFVEVDDEHHLQVVDLRTHEIVVAHTLETPRLGGRRPCIDLVAVAQDCMCYAMLCHDAQCASLEIFSFRRVSAQSFCCCDWNVTGNFDMSVCALKFSVTDVTLLACSAAGDTRLYEIDTVSEIVVLVWKRSDTWVSQLGFWGRAGHLACAPDYRGEGFQEIHSINFDTQEMLPLFKLSCTERVPEAEHGTVALISVFASSPTSDYIWVALTSLQLLRFQVTLANKSPVDLADCEWCMNLSIIIENPGRWLCAVALDWSDMGVILGDSYCDFYIVGEDFILMLGSDGHLTRTCSAGSESRPEAVPSKSCACSISEVFFLMSR